MEYCAVVPHIVCAGRQLGFGNIGDEPLDLFRAFPYSLLAHIDGSLGNIEDSDILVSVSKQVVNQR